jgi:hypothetical protein
LVIKIPAEDRKKEIEARMVALQVPGPSNFSNPGDKEHYLFDLRNNLLKVLVTGNKYIFDREIYSNTIHFLNTEIMRVEEQLAVDSKEKK